MRSGLSGLARAQAGGELRPRVDLAQAGAVPRVLARAAVAVLLLATGAEGEAAEAPAPPAPHLALERAEIVGTVPVPLTLWFTGERADTVAGVCIRMTGPGFLALRPAPGQPTAPGACAGAAALGPFAGAGPIRLELAAVEAVTEGKVNLAFAVDWAAAGVAARRVVVEKTVEIGVLGTGAVAGLPLQLTAYVLPGLLLLITARLLGAGWAAGLGSLEQGTIAFLTSVGLVTATTALAGAVGMVRLAGPGMSVGKLVAGAVLGVIVGGALAGIAALLRWQAAASDRAAAARAALLIARDDGFATAARKALEQAGDKFDSRREALVRVRASATYAGSMAAEGTDGERVLLGWQRVTVTDPTIHGELMALANANRFVELARRIEALIAADPAAIGDENAVQKVAENGDETTGEPLKRFASQTVAQIATRAAKVGPDALPFVLAPLRAARGAPGGGGPKQNR
jgi:hypothetical protein